MKIKKSKLIIPIIGLTILVGCSVMIGTNASSYQNATLTLNNSVPEQEQLYTETQKEITTVSNISKTKEELYSELGFTDEDLRENNIVVLSDAEITKEYIYDRILNTPDYFQTLTGTYRRETEEGQGNYNVDFKVRLGSNPKSMETVISDNGESSITLFNGEQTQTVNFNGISEQALNSNGNIVDNKISTVNIEENLNTDVVSLVKSQNRIKTDDDGINMIYYRTDPTMLPTARESIFSQERGMGFLNDFTTWSIDGQETFLNRNCCIINGTLKGEYADKLNTYSFKLYVDTETGILLKWKCFNSQGKLIDSLVSTSININSNISDDVFNIELPKQ